MKRSLFLLFLAIFTYVASGHAQQTAEDAAHTGAIHRPTPAATSAPISNKPLEASLSADEKGKSSASSTTTFSTTTEKIYLNFTHEGATKGQKLKVVWIAEEAKGYAKNKQITENAATLPGPGSLGSYYIPAKGLPPGKYRVEVSEDGKVVKSLKFAIK